MDDDLHPQRSGHPCLQTCPLPIFAIIHLEFIRINLVLPRIPVYFVRNSRLPGHPCHPHSNSHKILHPPSSIPCFHHSPTSETLPLHPLEFPVPWQLNLLRLQTFLSISSWASHSNWTQSLPWELLFWKPSPVVSSFSHSLTTADYRGGEGTPPPSSSLPFQTLSVHPALLLKLPDLNLLTSDYIKNNSSF